MCAVLSLKKNVIVNAIKMGIDELVFSSALLNTELINSYVELPVIRN